MSDLIERVAKAANWTVTVDECDLASPFATTADGQIFPIENGELTTDGLVFLLRELLQAEWEITWSGQYVLAHAWHDAIEDEELERAACLAFLAHKGER